jgi:hypothetical protein
MSIARAFAVLVLLGAAARVSADELRALSGKNVSGTLKKIDADSIVMQTDAGEISTPLSQVLALDRKAINPLVGDTQYYEIRLVGDSVLAAREIVYSAKDVQVTLLSGAAVKLPLTSVVSVLKDAQDANIRKQFRNLSKARARTDRILVYKDGELNAVDGALGDVDADGKAIEFKREGNAAIKARFAFLQGMTFLRTEAAPEAICKVIDQDGSTLAAAKLAYDGTTLTVGTPFGASVALKGDDVARLDFNLGRLTYLSDLEPSKLMDNAFFGGFPSYRKDVNQDGRPIVLLDKAFVKGVTIEGAGAVEFNLNSKYKDFKAFVGADTRSAEGGLAKTTVTIFCDGVKQATATVVPTQLIPIAVSVKDVSTLRIVVEGPNFTGLSSYVTLADARVSQ